MFADTVRRALLWKGYEVRHVVNITDVGHLLAPGERATVDALVARRQDARESRDFALADELRDRLLADHGITVADTPTGPTYHRTAPTTPS